MPVPLYGFMEGDTIGQLILADENETIASLIHKLGQAASIRVAPKPDVQLVYQHRVVDPALTVTEAGLTALERFDVRETHADGLFEDRDAR